MADAEKEWLANNPEWLTDSKEWHRLTKNLRRKLARQGQTLHISRGEMPQMWVSDRQTRLCVRGPGDATPDTVHRWLED